MVIPLGVPVLPDVNTIYSQSEGEILPQKAGIWTVESSPWLMRVQHNEDTSRLCDS